jgi:hypothetical protein
LRLLGIDDDAGHAVAILQRHGFGEDLEVVLIGQRVEIAIAAEVDFLAVLVGEGGVHLQATQPDLDVGGVAERGAHAAGGPTR